MSKDARLTIRIGTDLDEWLNQEAAQRGLDKAAVARMMLYERKNGAPVAEANGSQTQPVYAPPVVVTPLEQLAPAASLDGGEFEPMPPAAYEPPAEPVDVDALVDQQFAEADAQGLTAAKPEEQPASLDDTGGVRVVGGRTPPRYSVSRQPGWIAPP